MEKEEEHKESVDSLLCPSFSTYSHSSNKLADIAEKVIQNDNDFNANDNDFEFVAFRKAAADGVFLDGDSGRFFPIFNRDLVTATATAEKDDAAAIQFPMRNLLIGDEEKRREPSPTSSSSSEVEDDLVAIPAGTYCVWTPNSVQDSPNRCKKSNSTGTSSSSSKRWKLLDLLRRSNSDGKESSSLVLLTPSSDSTKKKGVKGESSKEQCGSRRAEGVTSRFAGKKIPAAVAAASGGEKKVFTAAHEALYLRNREMRKRSYLPYRQDLVGFFSFLSHRKF